MKYRIEIERVSNGPRPWESRVWVAPDDGVFDHNTLLITSSDKTAADALEEASFHLHLESIDRPKVTYSVCPQHPSGLHEWEAIGPSKDLKLLLVDSGSDALNVIPQSDAKCRLCGKLYSEHAT